MKMTRCPEKHLYDADKYETCPYCSGEIRVAESGIAPKKAKIVKVRAVRSHHNSDIEVRSAEHQTEVKFEQKLDSPKKEEKSEIKMPELQKKGEKIDKLLYGCYSTISLGYAGLCECTVYMTGKPHTAC